MIPHRPDTSAVQILPVDESDTEAKFALVSYYRELSERFGQKFDPGESSGEREFSPPKGLFLIARLEGLTVGCAALRCFTEYGELKRMWVDPAFRGRGIASALLSRLEKEALQMGKSILRLDTNEHLNEAKALYLRHGYREIPRYNDNPHATHFYEKHLPLESE